MGKELLLGLVFGLVVGVGLVVLLSYVPNPRISKDPGDAVWGIE